MKIATWNVNSLRARLTHVVAWLKNVQPDILAVQETKAQDADFPAVAFEEIGYQVLYSGQKSYNGVALFSRIAGKDWVVDPDNLDDPQRRILVATYDQLRIINLYVPNGSEVGSEKFVYKLDWLRKITDFIRRQAERYPHLIVLGDFNIAPADADVHDPELWRDAILCSAPERAAFQALLELGLHDAFRLFAQADNSFSWWDYRGAGFRRNLGLRIDHILISSALKPQCIACSIDKTPRKLEKPSDHAPVLLELNS